MGFDTIQATIVEARHLAAMSKSGTSDAYCTMETTFNQQKYKTKKVKHTLSPIWNESFKFFSSSAESGRIHLKLWHYNLIGKDEFMGELYVPLTDLADGLEHDKWVSLQSEPAKKKQDPSVLGEVRIKIIFTGPPGTTVKSKKEEATKEKEPAPASNKTDKAEPKDKNDASKDKKKTDVKIEDKYNIDPKPIGKGAFSEVKKGVRKSNGVTYAIKCISKKLIDKKELQLLEREIDIMKKLDHPNIIKLMEVIDTPQTLYLVLEFAEGGELFDSIVNKGQYTEPEAINIVKQILEAVQYIHTMGIAHRDLKPENLLLAASKEGKEVIKIADFGLSKDFGEEALQTSCGTPDYVAPEVLLGEPYDSAVDIWSIGVITYVLLCGFPPFYGEVQKDLFDNIMAGNFDFPDPEWTDVSEEAKDFIKKILIVDPAKRMTAEEALQHQWVTQGTKKSLHRLETFNVQKFKEYTSKYKQQNQK